MYNVYIHTTSVFHSKDKRRFELRQSTIAESDESPMLYTYILLHNSHFFFKDKRRFELQQTFWFVESDESPLYIHIYILYIVYK